MEWQDAPDVKFRLDRLLRADLFPYVRGTKIAALRGHGSTSRAIARIWSLPRPWQQVLGIDPQYIIEVITERFDRLSDQDKDRTLIHELMHIPKSFSGALVAHRGGGRGRPHRIDRHTVEVLYQKYIQSQ
ncbi:MAG: metallopeptidase [Patescibacteria group bacterium]|nr:metallopeptidase [Patescibacteria group bacterium]MCL5432337.1 metallopeptidase [Patescibacteria group bacterium]